MFRVLEELAQKQNPLDIQAEGRREGGQRGRRRSSKSARTCPGFSEKGTALLLVLLCHLKIKSGLHSPLQPPHRLISCHALLHLCITPDRKLLLDNWTKSWEVSGLGSVMVQSDISVSVASPCDDLVAARDANYALHLQTQGQGDIQTTGTFYTGIFITSSKACESNEGVLQGGGGSGKYRALPW